MEFLRAEAQLGAEQFSDKKQVWINDKEHGFAKAFVLEDKGDSYKVQKAQSSEVCFFFSIFLVRTDLPSIIVSLYLPCL